MKNFLEKQNARKLWKQGAAWMNTGITVSVLGKKISFRPMKAAIIIAAWILALTFLVQLLLIPMHRPRTIDLGFTTGSDYAMQTHGESLLLYNNQNLKEVNHRGEVVWSVPLALSLPLIEDGGEYVLAADLGGNHQAGVYKDGQKLQEYHLGRDIISAKINPKGTAVFATSADGYKGSVVVMDKKGRETFRWNSGDGYIMDLDISDDGHYLAVAQLSTDGELADARIQFLDLYQKKVIQTVERPGSIIGEVRFSDGRLLTVSDTEFCGFSGRGKLLYSVSFAGKNPGKYDISNDELLAFETHDHRGNIVLEIYNTRGKKKGSFLAESTISDFAVHQDTVVIASQREILAVNRRGKLKKRIGSAHDIKMVGVFGNGKTVLAAGSTEADVLWVK